MEDALRTSEANYRVVADNTYGWEWWLNSEGRFLYMSPSCKTVTGHDPDEFVADSRALLGIIHPDDQRAFIDHFEKVDAEQKGGEVEFRIVRPDGSHRWIAHVCRPVFGPEGEFLGHRGSNRDETERKLAENALRESESRLRVLSSQLLAVQENERRRIALELHDAVNQSLAAVKFGLESKIARMSPRDTPDELSLENIVSLVQHSIEEVRRIQMELRPSVLDDLGVLAALSWFVREYQRVYTHIQTELLTELEEQEVPDVLKIVIFRIVQEALSNVARHSRADRTRVAMRRDEESIELVIEDNGRGFNVGAINGGLGLTSMRERAELSGGSFEIRSEDGKGTTIRATWPRGESTVN